MLGLYICLGLPTPRATLKTQCVSIIVVSPLSPECSGSEKLVQVSEKERFVMDLLTFGQK